MGKKQLKIKKTTQSIINKFSSPFKNKNNHRIISALLILISIYLVIAFISFFFEWKSDDSVVNGKSITEVITNKDINNMIGGFGAFIANLLIKRWFGITAFLIPLITFSIGMKIIGFRILRIRKLIINSLLAFIILPIVISHFFSNSVLAGGVGIFTNSLLNSIIGEIGTTLMLIVFTLTYASILFDVDPSNIINTIKNIREKITAKKKDNIIINTELKKDSLDINEDIEEININTKV